MRPATAHPIFSTYGTTNEHETTAGWIMHTPEGWVPIVAERTYFPNGDFDTKYERKYPAVASPAEAAETVEYRHWVYKGCPDNA